MQKVAKQFYSGDLPPTGKYANSHTIPAVPTTDDPPAIPGEVFVRLRVAHKFKDQQEIGLAMGFTGEHAGQTWSDLERGRRRLTLQLLLRMAEAFKMTPSAVLAQIESLQQAVSGVTVPVEAQRQSHIEALHAPSRLSVSAEGVEQVREFNRSIIRNATAIQRAAARALKVLDAAADRPVPGVGPEAPALGPDGTDRRSGPR
jgi:transcriptional regulator with XRE-family HTH domain